MGSHVACLSKKTNACRILVGKPERKSYLEDPDIDWGRIILKKYK